MLKSIVIIWIIFLIAASGFISYNIGKFKVTRQKDKIIAELETNATKNTKSIEQKDGIITALRDRISKVVESSQDLSNHYNQLQTQVLGLTTIQKQTYPFQVPTNGFLGSYAGSYGGNMQGQRHLGVDIWTSIANGGKVAGGIGNPVYSACDGLVENIDLKNAAILIKCNKISKDFSVPEYDVYTYYGHMGDVSTKNLFIEVDKGVRVKIGQYLGFQGNLSAYFPEMQNVHLHFSVFAGLSENDPKKGALNPCLYIGGDCAKQSYEFKTSLGIE